MIQRRHLVSATIVALAAPSVALSALRVGASNLRSRAHTANDSDYLEGCIFACEGSLSSQIGGAATIDFWTSRVSDIECADLPTSCRRIVIWDDLLSLRRLSRSLAEILDIILRFWGFDARHHPHQAAIYLDQISNLDEVVLSVLSARSKPFESARTAIVDLDSAGVTSLGWHRFLPHLRAHYDYVLGIGSDNRGIDDIDAEFCNCSENHLRAFSDYCDLVVLIPASADADHPCSHPEYDEIVAYRTECVRTLVMSPLERLLSIGGMLGCENKVLQFSEAKHLFAEESVQ